MSVVEKSMCCRTLNNSVHDCRLATLFTSAVANLNDYKLKKFQKSTKQHQVASAKLPAKGLMQIFYRSDTLSRSQQKPTQVQ